jgi:dTDP-4-amino-4,6-dideoxygalactose transaminase
VPDRVPALDLSTEYSSFRDDIEAAVRAVLRSGRYIGGPEVEGLEREFAAVCGVAHGAAVHSGTDALRLALLAAGLRPGDEVITSPFTFIGTTEAIHQAGGKTVFVDIDPGTFTIDPARVEAGLTGRTRALLPVHLYGQTADMPALGATASRRSLLMIEDACQAHGALSGGRPAGGLGTAGCFSFYPTKNLGACGEGGLVTTDDAAVAERVKRLRDHGQAEKYVHVEEGYNGRLDALQAAILRVKLRRLHALNDARRALAASYRERLAALEASGLLRLPAERSGDRHVYHQFAARIPRQRDRVRARLLEQGIETGTHYPIPLHRQPCYAWMGLAEGSFPEAERAAREVLTLPLHPALQEAQLERICRALAAALGAA